jgi:hypothetical protein
MQNAYASYQFTQLMGRFSLLAAVAVHVLAGLAGLHEPRLASVGSMSVVLFQSVASQPVSYPPPGPLFTSPIPPFKYAWMPDPDGG